MENPARPELPPAAQPKSKRRAGWIVTVALLSVALVAALAVLTLSFLRLEEARTHIDEQRDLIEDQRDRIGEQEELIEKKETFAAAMSALVATASEFDGEPFGTLVRDSFHQAIAKRGWSARWDAAEMDQAISVAREAADELTEFAAGAREDARENRTGTTYEAVLDRLGDGFVTASIDDADALCEQDVLGCVMSTDPYTVHFDAEDASLPYMTDWLRTGLAYHEFAHVLQMTNPEPTQKAVKAFDGDEEVMADCFALTYLDGWALDHRIWTSDIEYWDVSMGYGHTCDDRQRKAVRDWYERLGYESRPITQ